MRETLPVVNSDFDLHLTSLKVPDVLDTTPDFAHPTSRSYNSGMAMISRNWVRILSWGLVLGLLASLIADWGEWDRFLLNLLWRILITIAGGVIGMILNIFASGYVNMGTNVIESMGITRFSNDTAQKIENSFVFVLALTAAILSMIFIT